MILWAEREITRLSFWHKIRTYGSCKGVVGCFAACVLFSNGSSACLVTDVFPYSFVKRPVRGCLCTMSWKWTWHILRYCHEESSFSHGRVLNTVNIQR
jgi:hypothetical protein